MGSEPAPPELDDELPPPELDDEVPPPEPNDVPAPEPEDPPEFEPDDAGGFMLEPGPESGPEPLELDPVPEPDPAAVEAPPELFAPPTPASPLGPPLAPPPLHPAETVHATTSVTRASTFVRRAPAFESDRDDFTISQTRQAQVSAHQRRMATGPQAGPYAVFLWSVR